MNIKIMYNIIASHGAIKDVDLRLYIMSINGPFSFEESEYLSMIDVLLNTGEVLSLIYSFKDKTNIMYFPARTSFIIGSK